MKKKFEMTCTDLFVVFLQKKKPELKPNREKISTIYKNKKEMQEREKPCEGVGGNPVL